MENNYNRSNGKNSFRGGRRPYNQGQGFRPRPARNPLPEGFSLYYIAILCPGEIDEKVNGFKNHMYQRYGCKSASKSPAHITIVPPFRGEDELQPQLLDFVSTYNIGIVPFDITMQGYGNFGERVLYIDITPNEALHQLEAECMQEFNQQFPSIIFGMKPPFNPHVTIATRDIPEGMLEEAKMYFETQHPYYETFTASSLHLLKLENGRWKVL